MKKNEVRVFVTLTVSLTALLWGGILGVVGKSPFSITSLKALNMTATFITILWAVFFSWGWRWPYLRKILFRPDLNGSWIGEFRSDWKDESGNGIPPGPFVLVIRQSFFSISIRAYTQKLKTSSYVESLVFDGERGLKILAYLFSEKRSGVGVEQGSRQGAADLEIIEEPGRRILEGDFWTHAGTTGFVRVRRASVNKFVESFVHANENWPNKEQWASVWR